MKRLILVDGNALVHRAYHATPPLSTSKGELVNAVYGFTSIILKALEELQPDYLAVAWDTKAPTFRHAQYEDYKATRGPADEALFAQFKRADEILDAFSVPEFRLAGFEADDIVATLARQAEEKEKNLEIIIMTGDRDMMQLINKRIKVLMPKKTISDVGLYGEEEFVLRYGFDPKHLIDYKALAGDASDNVPGVPGIGEVSATKLIQQYETVEKVYKHLKELPERTQKLLKEGEESALMSKKLVILDTNVPIKLDLIACRVHEFDRQKAKALFEELEFRSLINKIPGLVVDSKTYSVSQNSQSTTDLDHQVEPILEKMSQTGVMVDLKFLNKLGTDLKSKLTNLEQEIYSIIGHQVNLNSPKQLSEVLFDQLQLPVVKKTKTGRSTDEETLHELAKINPIASLLLQYRSLFKLISTYVDALPKYVKEDKRIHSTFNVEGAATGRLSSQDPNLQNIPVKGEMGGEIRKAFIATKGKVLLSADYSQIELRIMADMSGDPGLKLAFDERLDIHTATASKIFNVPLEKVTKEQRMVGKTMNFATLYGQGPHALSRQLGVEYHIAQQYIDEYFAQFPKVKEWFSKTLDWAREHGYTETLWGRKRYIPELQASNRMMVAAGERMAANMPVQGTAADMIKKAMVEIEKSLESRVKSPGKKNTRFKTLATSDSCRLILQVHDELLFECDPKCADEVAKMVKEKMENALKLSVPVMVDLKIGPNWGEMKPLEV